jgi:SAM-dependent methyltransferase
MTPKKGTSMSAVQKRVIRRTRDRQIIDKYDLYSQAVQAADVDVEFFRDTYKSLTGVEPKVLREDFCGTFLLCCEWVKSGPNKVAYGLDLDPEPIGYGIRRYLPKLKAPQQKRVHIEQKNVMDPSAPHADLVAAMNFSYSLFKKRRELKAYFQNVYDTLNPGGVFLLDCFGGSQCQGAIEDVTDHDDFIYYWDQVNFSPVTHEAQFYIHFKPKGGKKLRKIFEYDWRLWTIPELVDLMDEVGFAKSVVYWEGTEGEEGNGIFEPTDIGEECESWVAYVVGVKPS